MRGNNFLALIEGGKRKKLKIKINNNNKKNHSNSFQSFQKGKDPKK